MKSAALELARRHEAETFDRFSSHGGSASAAATRRLCSRFDVLRVPNPTERREVMGAIEFDPDEIAAKVPGCNERRAGAAERVKHGPAGLAERAD